MIYLCRLCASLKKPDYLVTINDETNDICQKAKVCCQVEIKMKDPKPKQICRECVESLNDCYKFYMKVKDAQEALETIYPAAEEDNENEEDDRNGPLETEQVPKQSAEARTENQTIFKEAERPKEKLVNRIKPIVKQEKATVKAVPRRSQGHSKSRMMTKKTAVKVKPERVDVEIPATIHASSASNETEIVVAHESAASDNDNDGYLEEVYTILDMAKDDGDQIQLQSVSEYGNNKISNNDEANSYVEDETSQGYDIEDQDVHINAGTKDECLAEQTDSERQVFVEESIVDEMEIQEVEEEDDFANEGTDGNKDFSTLPPHLQLSHWTSYPFLCSSCDYKAITPMDLFKHVNATHYIANFADMQYKCYDCKKLMTHYSFFLNLIRMKHHPALKLKCDACDMPFKDFVQYANHRARVCPQLSQYPEVLPCKQCCRNFHSTNGLQTHVKHHHAEKGNKEKYKCQYCNKEYTWKRSLINHELTHSHKREFSCKQCDKQFFSKAHLESHILTHNSDKQYECHICHKNFKTGTILERHQMVHTDIKPFSCKYCPKTFRTRMECVTHERVHTGETPLQCTYCDKRFRFRSALSAHLKVHTGVKEHACEHCPKKFTDLSNFYKHMRRKHSDVNARN
ncbi:zinc finger and BTB domain-containing protein 17 [Musca domestica]|uniref:Zinc finger and BTB domain-containing protein 17 n=1 Tax=Musca domestica TaxID=7370 RepID=A0A1I8MT30_MUSDO|nr:zinc finger and BTB domain-containing protein 17 [Musca domestica]